MLGANQQVFRSVSLDAGKIQQNVQNWVNEASLAPGDFEVVNALPQNQAELERLGFAGADWPQWQSFHEDFSKAVPKGVSVATTATKAVSLNALQSKKSVLFVVAHSDGFSIRFPGGESLDVKDLEAVKAQIGANHPKVFLFSCETASVKETQSFAKALLDNGAQAVVAPVTQIRVASALNLFSSFFVRTLGPEKLPLSEAYQKAMESTGERSMEVWVASVERRRPSFPSDAG
jgi:hypothetical protein